MKFTRRDFFVDVSAAIPSALRLLEASESPPERS
jgi:hypothetical protein